MIRPLRTLLAVSLLMALGAAVIAGCDDDTSAGVSGREAQQETRRTLEDLRTEISGDVTPERKQQMLQRCRTAVDRLRRSDDPQADRLADFCQSLEATNPDTPAAWNDIRARLDELITQFRG